MLVIEVVSRDHVVHILAVSMTLLQLRNRVFEVLCLQIELLLAHGAIFLVPLHCIIEESFLALQHLHQLLCLGTEPVYVLVR